MAKQQLTATQIIDALRETKGMVYIAAEKLGVSHTTIYNYAKRYKAVQQAIDEQRGKVTDVAELALYRAIQAGEAWAVTFYLKTIGRTRGYVEKQEIEHSGNMLHQWVEGLKQVDNGTMADSESKSV